MPDLLLPQADAVDEVCGNADVAVALDDGVAFLVAPGPPLLDRVARLAGFELLALLVGLVVAEERVLESGSDAVEGWKAFRVGKQLVAEEGEGHFHVR